MKKLILLSLAFGSLTGCVKYDAAITESELKKSVYFLASDSLKGRMTGSPDIRRAAGYLADRFREMGLHPLGDSSGYFSYYDFVAGAEPDSAVFIETAGRKLVQGQEFTLRSFSGTGEATGLPVVFTGFGVRSDSLGYDDYSGVDVSGKIVLVLRYSPEGDNPHSAFNPVSSFRQKARLAKEKGAAAVFFVNSTEDENDVLAKLDYDRGGNLPVPVFNLKRSVADSWLKSAGKPSLSELESAGKRTKKPASFILPGVQVSYHAGLNLIRKPAFNVVGLLPGTDSLLKKEYVVIGAHYDHWGLGGAGSLYRGDEPQIHNGADDNASGTAGIIELAQAVAGSEKLPKRSLIVAAFSGEELGLLGSSALVNEFPVPVTQVVTMMNFDMIGRLDSVNQLVMYGMGTSSRFKALADSLNKPYGFKLSFKDEGFGPSDHSSFYSKDVPVLFYHTGLHSDYHRPSDDADKINYPGTEKVMQYASDMLQVLLNQPVKPDFIRVKSQSAGRSMAFNVYIGTIPDYASNEKGLKITGVNPGSPAEKAGLKGGDLITRIGETEIGSIYDYTDALSKLKAGKEEVLVYKRNGQEVKGILIPAKRNQ
ncbi:MAG: M28 family peptidase [Bacteroidetes bacterium]|nr:M28 family peptidase [Bacteroidota bacterium]